MRRRLLPTGFVLLTCLVCTSSCDRHEAYGILDEAHSLERSESYDEALERFERAAALYPDAEIRTELAGAYLRRKRFDEAVELLQIVLEAEPEFVDGVRYLAAAFSAQEDVDAAIGVLEQFVADTPGLPEIERDLTHLYMLQDRFDLAIERLKGVVERHPGEGWAHMQLGHLYFQLQAFDQAVASYFLAVAAAPEGPRAHGALGNAYYELKDIDAAIRHYQTAMDMNPRDHRSMNNLAWLFATENVRIKDGLVLSRRSLRLRPGSPTYLDTLAELHYRNGDPDRALTLIERALSNAGGDEADATLLDHLRRQHAKFTAAGQGRV